MMNENDQLMTHFISCKTFASKVHPISAYQQREDELNLTKATHTHTHIKRRIYTILVHILSSAHRPGMTIVN